MVGEGEVAKPVNDNEALRITEELLLTLRPELTKVERYRLALKSTNSVKILENHRAVIAKLGRATDQAVMGVGDDQA